MITTERKQNKVSAMHTARIIIKRELKRMIRYKLILSIGLVLPMIAGLIIMFLFNTGIATDLPIAVLDKDRSSLSRQIVRALDASPDLSVAYRVDDLYAARQLLLSGKIYAIVMLPSNLERDSLLGRSPEIVSFYDNQFMTAGSVVSKGINAVIGAVSADINIELATKMGTPRSVAAASLSPIPLDQHILFNPSLNYQYSLLNGIWSALMQIIICVIVTYVIAQERRSLRKKRVFSRLTDSRPFLGLAAKLFPYLVLFSTILAVADMTFLIYLGLPFNGSITLLLIGGLLFMAGYFLYGIIFAYLFKSENALSNASLLTAPAFGFTGVAFPRLAMGVFPQVFGAILPITWYIEIRADQTLRGADLSASLVPLSYLLLLDCVLLLIAFLVIKRKTWQENKFTEQPQKDLAL
ncbi:ABC transporter [Gammaproteobacteria bacterium]|nr:ABC transporter [Gammaproteobacteria bacterium]